MKKYNGEKNRKSTNNKKDIKELKSFYQFTLIASCVFILFGVVMTVHKVSGNSVDMGQYGTCLIYATIFGIISWICSKKYKEAKSEFKMRETIDSEFKFMNQMEM